MNSDIHNLSQVINVAAGDEFEVQISGETVTKKCTLSQLTQIEKTAREAQDDAIELAVGLNANGTYPTSSFTDSWYLRTADYVSIVDRSGLVENLSSAFANALRILDYRLHSVNQLLVAEVTLTSAEIKDLHNNAKVFITEETGYVIDVLSVTGFLDYIAPAYANNNADSLKFGYSGGYPMFEMTNSFYVATVDKIFRGLHTAQEELTVGTEFAVYCDSAIITGNSTMKFNVVYRKLAV